MHLSLMMSSSSFTSTGTSLPSLISMLYLHPHLLTLNLMIESEYFILIGYFRTPGSRPRFGAVILMAPSNDRDPYHTICHVAVVALVGSLHMIDQHPLRCHSTFHPYLPTHYHCPSPASKFQAWSFACNVKSCKLQPWPSPTRNPSILLQTQRRWKEIVP